MSGSPTQPVENTICLTCSVVLPVFRSKPWIQACIESLCAQTLRDIEFIFVDDCGNDGAMRLVEEAATHDSRIRIIRNPYNLGPGGSRNKGIEAARGRYLAFYDPDDLVDSAYYEELYREAETQGFPDIVVGAAVGDKGTADIIWGMHQKRFADALKRGIDPVDCPYFLHQTALYAHSLFSNNPDVCYGLTSNSEDMVFLMRALNRAQRIEVVESPKHYYHYCSHTEQQTSAYNLNRYIQEFLATEDMVEYALEHTVKRGAGYAAVGRSLANLLRLRQFMKQDPTLAKYAAAYFEEIRALAIRLPGAGGGYFQAHRIPAYALCQGIDLLPLQPAWMKVKKLMQRY